jgi:DNA-binding transcriptional LysR family regulator
MQGFGGGPGLNPGSPIRTMQDFVTYARAHPCKLVPVKEIELPFRPPHIQVQQYWHRRMQNDAAHRWLRGIFYEVNRRDAGAQMPA